MPEQKLKQLQLVVEIRHPGVPFSIRGSIRFDFQEEVEDELEYAAWTLAENQESTQGDNHILRHRPLTAGPSLGEHDSHTLGIGALKVPGHSTIESQL